MRIVKEPETRKNEILDTAEKLFTVKGYEAATVNDILEETGIAKGTFYYYFKSKEDALDAIIMRRINGFMASVRAIAADPGIAAPAKLLSVIMALKPQNQVQEEFVPVLHEQGNAQFHQKSLVESVIHLTPVLSDIIDEGNQQEFFDTPYPKESAELLLAAAIVLFDDGFFRQTPEEKTAKADAFICAMERVLGARPGSMSDFENLF